MCGASALPAGVHDLYRLVDIRAFCLSMQVRTAAVGFPYRWP